jgi:O-antigen ligase
MAIRAHKEIRENQSKRASSGTEKFSGKVELLLVSLYLCVELIPQLGSIEVMGPQWLYLSLLNLISVGYISVNHNTTLSKLINLLSKNTLTLLYLAVFILCGVSILFALNPIESIVVYSRFIITFLSFSIICTLIYCYPKNIKTIFQFVSIISLFQCLYLLKYYLDNVGNISLNYLLLSITGTTGNKNVLAASFVIKSPIIIYCVFQYFSWWRNTLNIVSLVSIAILIFLLNARAAYLGFFIQILLFSIFLLYDNKLNGKKQTVRHFFIILIPILVGLSISQFLLVKGNKDKQKDGYGTIDKRLATLSDHNESSSSTRLFFWNNALKQIKENPLTGCGYGNWKIESVKYEYGFYNDFNYSKHVHNDFLQIAAEAGIPAGILFLSIFLFALIFTVRVLLSEANQEIKLLSVISFMALAGYFTDATFNFPAERPIMQVYFAFFLALNVILYLIAIPREKNIQKGQNIRFIPLAIGIILTIASIYVSWQVYQSMRVQTLTHFNFGTAQPGVTWMDVNPKFPSIPNLAENNIPINDIKAWYLFRSQKYDEALYLLNQDKNANPYSMSKEWLKASIYTSRSMIDSAHYYSKKGFFIRPRNLSLFNIISRTSVPLNDTTTIQKAFKEYRKYRNEPHAWKIYIRSLFAVHYDRTELIELADSLAKVYPNDSEIQHTRFFIRAGFAGMKRDFPEALENLLGIMKLNPNDYENMENIGITYYFLKDYNSAASYFKRVVDARVYPNGKSEFYLGNCLLQLGRKEEACKYLYVAANRNYQGAAILFNKNNCTLNTQKP